MDNWKVTIKDILTRERFKHAELVAGKGGLNREITWTHILETGDMESFINGGELILTTGSGIKFDSPDAIPYIEKLRRKNVAGICIELGTCVKKIHPEIIKYGNDRHFPLIIFKEIIKFVDITQDLHTLIVNHHHQMLSQLNTFSQKVNELSLLPNGILKILKELYVYSKMEIVFIPDEAKTYYYPPKIKDDITSIQTLMKQSNTHEPYESYLQNDHYYTFFPLKGLGNTWGCLCLKGKSKELDEFSFSMIDRAILAIAQIMLRNRTIEERKQNQEEEIVRKFLQGEHYDVSEIQKVLPAPAKNLNYRLILVQTLSPDINTKEGDWEEIKLQQSIIIRSIFRSNGCIPALSVGKNEIVIIASFYKHEDAIKDTERFTKIVQDIKNIEEKNIFLGGEYVLGISNVKHDYSSLHQSYREAKDVILIQSTNLLQTYFFDKIGVYRILIEMLSNKNLDAFVQEYLGPILKHDKVMKSNLLLTLSMYLNCLGSKKETADRLFIVRQTLYHRLEKIKELLGRDFMEPVNRQAIELALSAYNLLKNTDSHKDTKSYNQFA